jgi:hypothetical protein
MMRFCNRTSSVIFGLLAILIIFGCSDDHGSAPGVLAVSLTDGPACGFDEVSVTVSKLRIHQSSSADEKGGGWADITLNPPRKINLLDLNDATQPNFALESLGETPLAAGHYTQLRLGLVTNSGNQPLANSVVLSGTTTEIPLDTASGIQTGIKLIHQFEVGPGQRTDLLLDFDACKSIVQTGSNTYKLQPVIKVIPTPLNGINGFLDKTLPNVIVSAQQQGEIIRKTVMNTQTGEFFLGHLVPGTYDVVITADNHATAVISGVPVTTSTSITPVSTSAAPIPVVTPPTLVVSSTHMISGAVTLNNPAHDDATVVVAAQQALSGGPTVTVKSVVASVNSGNPVGDYFYALTLPTAVPSLGPYSTPLPIVFTAQPGSVGGAYTIRGLGQAETMVYTTQAPSPLSVNISGGDTLNQNLTLNP